MEKERKSNAKQSSKQKKLPKKKISPLIIFVVLCVAVFAFVNIISEKMELNKLEKELEEKEYYKAQLEAENERLKKIVETGDIDEYVIKIAHEKLGLAFRDEKVYKTE